MEPNESQNESTSVPQPAPEPPRPAPDSRPLCPPAWEEAEYPPVRVVKVTRVWPIVLAAVLSAVVMFFLTAIGMRLGQTREQPQPKPQTGTQTGTDAQGVYAHKLDQIKELIDYYYIGETDEEKLADAAAAGVMESLDEWSYYISADEYASFQESASNSYVGIGVTISSENVEVGLEIVDVTPDSPAYRAGLEIGDLLLAVEGQPVLDGSENALDITATKNRVRGQEGTDVTLTISHQGVIREVTITRATIKTVNVSWEMLEGDLAYIHIRNFQKYAAEDAVAAIRAAVKAGAKGLIFDVRYNPGGYKNELVALLDYLLPDDLALFRSVDYLGREEVDYSGDGHKLDIPMAVLVNYSSYSASEFFAAALQEYGAAVIVGEQTYGKGRFQYTLDLDDGSAINISVGQYTTPKGVSLVGKGITPDYPVELTDQQKMDLYYSRLTPADDDQLQKAIEVLTTP